MEPLWSRAVHALEDKKAADVVVLDVSGVCSFTDHIIVSTGMSDRQIRAMAQHVIETLGDPVSYTHLRAHETPEHLVCRLLLEKKNNHRTKHHTPPSH